MSTLTGTGALLRLILRRDRIRIPVWITATSGFLILLATSLSEVYRTPAELQARATLMANPAATALAGPGHGLDNYTLGALLANEMLGFVSVVVAIMSILMAGRHTRTEEAAGRTELLRASVIGRHAPLAAALIAVAGVNVALGMLIAVGLGSAGIEAVTWSGSLAFGAAVASVGIAFAGIAALTAQVVEHPRGASGMAGAAIGLAYTLRAAGDASGGGGAGMLSWFSPFGWAQATRAYVDERWWPLGLAVALALVAAAVAARLADHRDVAGGLVPPRPGRPAGSAALAHPVGFAARLHRASLIGWGAALLGVGLIYGTLVGEVERFVGQVEGLEDLLAVFGDAPIADAFLAMILSLIAMLCALAVALGVLRLRAEETTGRAELLLATPLSRARWAGSHLAVVVGGATGVLLAAAAGLGATAGVALADPGTVGVLLGSAFAYVPGLWVTAGLAVALYGWIPRATPLALTVVIYGLTVGMFEGLLGFPAWVANLSPFTHIPAVPAVSPSAAPLAAMTAAGTLLAASGLVALRRRDIAAT